MLKYILKRLVSLIPVLFIISIIIFSIVKAMPGDEVSAYLGIGSRVTPERRAAIEQLLGLDKGLVEQYFNWLFRFIQGDLGNSIQLKVSVGEVIGKYIWGTFLLNGTSLLVAMLISIPIGIKQAVKKYSIFDNFFTVFSLIGVSVPTFFFALLLIFFVAIPLGLPINGMVDPIKDSFGHDGILDYISDVGIHLLLPCIVLAFSSFATFSRYVRNSMIDVINQDYIRTARSKGLKEKIVIYRHAFRNALIPLVTLLGMYIPTLFSGAMILESVFIWPGLGQVLIQAIVKRDNSLVIACLMFTAILTVLGNLLADILYSVADPRIKLGGGDKHGKK